MRSLPLQSLTQKLSSSPAHWAHLTHLVIRNTMKGVHSLPVNTFHYSFCQIRNTTSQRVETSGPNWIWHQSPKLFSSTFQTAPVNCRTPPSPQAKETKRTGSSFPLFLPKPTTTYLNVQTVQVIPLWAMKWLQAFTVCYIVYAFPLSSSKVWHQIPLLSNVISKLLDNTHMWVTSLGY